MSPCLNDIVYVGIRRVLEVNNVQVVFLTSHLMIDNTLAMADTLVNVGVVPWCSDHFCLYECGHRDASETTQEEHPTWGLREGPRPAGPGVWRGCR